MSILIKGMEMPTKCAACWALDDYGDYPRCRITDEQRGYNFPIWEKRMDRCPLVSVPEHGRLIDKDALEADISASVVFSGREGNAEIIGAKKIINRLHVAPTIIPAEEGET